MQAVLALIVLKIAGSSSGAAFGENTRLIGSSKENTMARKSESAFEDGDFVVYPTHGQNDLGEVKARSALQWNLSCWRQGELSPIAAHRLASSGLGSTVIADHAGP